VKKQQGIYTTRTHFRKQKQGEATVIEKSSPRSIGEERNPGPHKMDNCGCTRQQDLDGGRGRTIASEGKDPSAENHGKSGVTLGLKEQGERVRGG